MSLTINICFTRLVQPSRQNLVQTKLVKGHKWLAACPPGPKQQEHLARVEQLFLTLTQGRGKLRPFLNREDKMVVRAKKFPFLPAKQYHIKYFVFSVFFHQEFFSPNKFFCIWWIVVNRETIRGPKFSSASVD